MKLISERKYLLLVILSLSLPLYLFWDFVVDDAYISFTYSKNLVQGFGLTYNGMYVEGFSNFLWTVLLSPFQLVGVDPLVSARILSIFSSILILLLLDNMIRTLTPRLTSSHLVILLTTVTLCSSFAAWVVGGLETVFFAFLVVLFLYIEIEVPQQAFYLSPIVVLMLSLTRPEGLLFIVILAVYRLYRYRRFERNLITSILIFILPFGLFLLWRYMTYGYLLPNTAYVKVQPSLRTVSLAFDWLITFFALRPMYSFVLLVSLGILIFEKKLIKHEWLLLLLVILAFMSFVLYSGRDWMPFHRFLVPIVPVMTLIMAVSFERFWHGIPGIFLMGLVAGVGLFELYMSTTLYREQTKEFGKYNQGLLEAGALIRQITSPDAVIAVEDSGAIAYKSERETIDILGLNNSFIAHNPDLDIADYMLSFDPEVVQLHVEPLPSGDFQGSSDSQVSAEILKEPQFSLCYEFFDEWESRPYMPYLFLRACD